MIRLFPLLALIAAGVAGFEMMTPENALAFELRKISRQSDGCATDPNHCIKVEAVFPLAVKGPRKVVQAINDTLDRRVRQSLAIFPVDDAAGLPSSIDEIIDRLLVDYEEFSREAAVPWTVETVGKVLFQAKNVAVIQLDNFSYTGGAHPNTFRYLVNFDTHTGSVLRLDELVADMGRLKLLAEVAFRKYHQLGGDANLNREGFFWDEKFDLAGNFALTETGLYFYYNPYEAAAYAVGPTEFVLPYDELKEVLAKKYLP